MNHAKIQLCQGQDSTFRIRSLSHSSLCKTFIGQYFLNFLRHANPQNYNY